MSEWINTHDAMPGPGECVLIWHNYRASEYGHVGIGWRMKQKNGKGECWIWAQGKRVEDEFGLIDDPMELIHTHTISPGDNYVTHWMPMLEAPAQGLR